MRNDARDWQLEATTLLRERNEARAALEKLRHCSHACLPPCPHSRKFEEATKSVLPPRRVTPYPAETGRG